MKKMKEISQTLADARGYIEQKRGKADTRYRPRFHAVPPVGWMNDPNGFFYDGEWYHLFYQHYPYEARWNDMHWGHWRTRDLVTWENLPVAMAPDMPWDACGCFSGTALPDGRGGAHILYTGVSDHMELQQQCYASFYGETMEKAVSNPVIPFTLLPEGYVRRDFRDPKLFRASDGYRAVMAAKHTEGGRLVCFSSADLEHWTCSGVFCPTEGLMPECPDIFPLEGKAAVLYSQVAGERPFPENRHPVLYALGSTDAACTRFEPGAWKQLDYGRSCYATQTCEGADGERIAVSWMASWTARYPTASPAYGWSGMMSLPRVLHRAGDRILQSPVPGLKSLRKEKASFITELNNSRTAFSGVGARHAEIHLSADVSRAEEMVLNVMEDSDGSVVLQWKQDVLRMEGRSVLMDNTDAISMPLPAQQGRIEMTVYVDNCILEIFAGGETMSALAFPDGEVYDMSVCARGTAHVEIDCWKLA